MALFYFLNLHQYTDSIPSWVANYDLQLLLPPKSEIRVANRDNHDNLPPETEIGPQIRKIHSNLRSNKGYYTVNHQSWKSA